MQINKISGNWLKTFVITKKKEASRAKTAKVTFILPTLLHDLAASRQVKNEHFFRTNFFL